MKTIKELREQRDMSQMQLAVRLGVSLATVGNWERNIHEPRASQLRALSEVFAVKMEDIAIPSVDESPESQRCD